MTTDSDSTFQFDVALSFAGEDRAFVDTIAVRLRAHRVKVFYDRYEKATLWGKDLYEHLDHVYQRAARYCVLFVSEHYARKVWTNHERKSAQRPTVGYIDARSTTSDELVDLILQKVQRPSEQVVPIAARVRVPRTAEQRRPLLAQQPPAWEYLLFAGVLAQGKEALEPKWRDHQLRYVRRAGPALSDAEVPNFINGAFRELAGLTSNLERILDVDAKERAFGPLGVPGNPVHIEHLGQRLLEMYEGLLDWSARIRGTPTSDHFSRALQLLASYADNPIAEMRAFIDRYMDETSRLSERLANQDDDDEPIQVVMYITFEIDEHVSREFSREMKRLRRRGLLR